MFVCDVMGGLWGGLCSRTAAAAVYSSAVVSPAALLLFPARLGNIGAMGEHRLISFPFIA